MGRSGRDQRALPGERFGREEGFSDVGWSVLTRLLLGSAITGAVCAALGWWLSIRWLQRAKP